MAATSDHSDVNVIGSGPGGASLAHRLAGTGKRILMLERGGYLPSNCWPTSTFAGRLPRHAVCETHTKICLKNASRNESHVCGWQKEGAA